MLSIVLPLLAVAILYSIVLEASESEHTIQPSDTEQLKKES